MKNMFGLDTSSLEVEDQEEKAAGDLMEVEAIKEGFLNDPKWIAQAKRIAKLPGVSPEVKIACMFLGPQQVLAQVLVLQPTALYDRGSEECFSTFYAYMLALGNQMWDVTYWVSMLVFMGMFGLKSDQGMITLKNLDELYVTELGEYVAESSAMYLTAFMAGISSLQETLEAKGVVFEEDNSVFDDVLVKKTTE